MSAEQLPDVTWRRLEELTREYERADARRVAATAALDEARRNEMAVMDAMRREAERLITLQHPEWVRPIKDRSKRAERETTALVRRAAWELVALIQRRVHDVGIAPARQPDTQRSE